MSKRSLRREYEAKLKAERERHAHTQAVLRDLATERGGVVVALVENRAKILEVLRVEPRLLWELLLPSERAERLEYEWTMATYENFHREPSSSLFGITPTSYSFWRDAPIMTTRTEGDDDAT